ncbi:MAG: HAD family hydrolase [Lachnospiraceae bacterium]|nr:HAD family hydrolase [Lachnospiraceae bacterium]
MLSDKELYIFDMDGTILNTIDDIAGAINYVLDIHGYPRRTVDEVKSFVGNGLKRALELSLPDGVAGDVLNQLFTELVAYYNEHSNIMTRPYEGIVEVIHKLREQGKIVAVVSNKRVEAVRDLCDIYFAGCFDMALGDQDGIARKPAPDMTNMVIEHYGILKDKCVYIGDSDVDLMTARNTEIDCIAVTWGFRTREFLVEHGATMIIDRPEELL